MELFKAPMDNLIPQVSFQSFWLVYGFPHSYRLNSGVQAVKICLLQIPTLLLGEAFVLYEF